MVRAFENLTKKIQSVERFDDFLRFQVFVLKYRAKWKDGKDGKFIKSCFNGKYISRMLFSWIKTEPLEKKIKLKLNLTKDLLKRKQ